jgi:acetate kinase
MRILVLNCGSSSLKFRLLEVGENPEGVNRVLVNGVVKDIGGTGSLELSAEGQAKSKTSKPVPDHAQAIQWMFEGLGKLSGREDHTIGLSQIDAVGHRVVHGGEIFSAPTLLDEAVEKEIEGLSELAPLHNPACLAGIRGARGILGKKVPMVAVFDTAFHQTMPAVAKTYALPYELVSRHRIHRYGFHGIAHTSLADGYAAFTGKTLSDTRIITLQLGNGCSVTAIAGGKSVETSMGFTPLEGLVMGSRSGDVDPSVVSYLSEKEQVKASEVELWLNEKSGLLGVSGRTNDMRELQEAVNEGKDERAKLAIEVFCYRAKKYIGAYLAVLGGADAIVFGGGIGENSPDVRARICEGMEWCGLQLDDERNNKAVGLQPGHGAKITREGSSLNAFVVAADEETWIARETVQCLEEFRVS